MFDGPLKGKRLTGIIATHRHPDHIGLGGWLAERHGVQLYASETEYLDSLVLRLDPTAERALSTSSCRTASTGRTPI